MSVALSAQWDRVALWTPAGLGVGIGAYFALPVEPDPATGVVAAVAALLALGSGFAARSRGGAFLLYATASLLAGYAAAVARTAVVDAPVLRAETGWVQVSGRVVESIEHADGRPRLVVAPSGVSGFWAEETPARIRVALKRGSGPWRPGDWVTFRARLSPPPEPVAPGAYDFARAGYFDRIGAYGFVAGEPRRIAAQAPLSAWDAAAARVAEIRHDVASRIRAALPGAQGAIAAALIAGDRSGIPEADLEALRDSSLQHLLSISGLHMAIVGLGLFTALRLLGAAIPPLALRVNLKKWAAGGALAGAFVYLLLSGASVPTQRSFIMIGLMFVAVMLDRSPFTLRIVAISATAILLVAPESLLDPSFQMSFAAVAALVAAFEAFEAWQARRGEPLVERDTFLGRGLYAVVASVLSSFVAGAASSPYASFHFNRIALYGVVANLLATPVVTFWVMPAGFLALLLMPLGLEAWALIPMGWGIDAILWIAHWVASWPGAAAVVASTPLWTLLAITAGGLWLIAWRGRVRALGLAGLALGLAGAPFAAEPDVLIDREARNVAVRLEDGSLALASGRRARFAAEEWLERDGDGRSLTEARAATAGAWRCDADVCETVQTRDGTTFTVRVVGPKGDAGSACATSADLVVIAQDIDDCAGAVDWVTPAKAAASGALALTWTGEGFETDSVAARRGDRPWSRPPQ